MEGKKARFFVDKSDKENADGVRGHLEAIGDSQGNNSSYRFIKRILDIILSFDGLVVLSQVCIIITLAIIIDDPGPVLFTQKRVGQKGISRFINIDQCACLRHTMFRLIC